MNIYELSEACETLRFCGGLALWRPVVTFESGPEVRIVVRLGVPHRDNPRDTSGICWTEVLDPQMIFHDQRRPEESIAAVVKGAVEHEILESMLWNGERRLDPHSGVSVHPSPMFRRRPAMSAAFSDALEGT